MFSLKNLKKLFLLILILNFIGVDRVIFAQNWPSLFNSQDLIPNSENDLKKLNKMNISKTSQEDMRKELFNSFHFIADFSSETLGERPREWIDATKNPQQAIELGYPQVIKRPRNEIYFPVYPLLKLSYFKGDSAVNSEINVCQTYWLQNLPQETFNCFTNLQTNILKKKYITTPTVDMQINILQGFFLLELMLNDVKEIQTNQEKVMPLNSEKLISIIKSIFNYVSTNYKETIYFPNKKGEEFINNYGDFFNSPHYLVDKAKFNPDKTYKSLLSDESAEVLTWIRSIMPVVYMNIIGLNNTNENFEKGFTAIDKLENYFKVFHFSKQKIGSAIQTSQSPKVNEEIFLKPLNNTDVLVMGDLYKALALQKSLQPDTALRYISSGILKNGDPDLASLLFKVSADTYFDFNILQLARRSYSWSEMYSKRFVDKVPSALFFGAESAFWIGQYDIAKSGFQRFLFASSDKKYAPQAQLRIATIEQLQGNKSNAKTLYEYIIRNLNQDPVAQDATVNLFCMNINNLTPKLRKLEYKDISEKIKFSRADLKRQAKACLMSSDLMDATAETFKDKKNNVVQKAEIQDKIIKTYNQEFPDNEFIVLFADRIKQLKLAEAALLATQNKCKNLIEYYGKNR
ncbi:MAG: hypothetical protein V4591_07125, partial [Bdellovibrionota bacterium]